MYLVLDLEDPNGTTLVVADSVAWCERGGERVTNRFSVETWDHLEHVRALGIEA